MQAVPGKRTALLTASLILSACGGGGGTVSTPAPTPLVTTPFTSWSTDLANSKVEAHGLGKQAPYTQDLIADKVSEVRPPQDVAAKAVFLLENSILKGLILTSGVEFAGGQISPLADPDFKVALSASSRAVISNPEKLTWNYQSFGVWETNLAQADRTAGVMSVGAPSPDSAIPGADGAKFTGKIVGSYVNTGGLGHIVLATLTVDANFSGPSPSLTFNTDIPKMSPDWNPNTFDNNPSLKLTNQVLTYSGTTNGFSGTLTTDSTDSTLTGNTKGQFYGTKAEELGGTFFLQGPQSTDPTKPTETYLGAYGAKR